MTIAMKYNSLASKSFPMQILDILYAKYLKYIPSSHIHRAYILYMANLEITSRYYIFILDVYGIWFQIKFSKASYHDKCMLKK